MKRSNDRRSQVLSFIKSRVEADARPPTLDEIAAACGLASRSAAQKHVRALEESGELQVTPGKARSARPKAKKPANPGARELFEVSARDVTQLSDTDLRALIARLCSARLADAKLPPDPVTWGGDQRAPDGGIDVRVQLADEDARRAGFSKGIVGFQVKSTKMGVPEIQREMCPGGLLRPSIRDLIQRNGAYVIATSDSAADGEYKKRVAAMRGAAVSAVDHGNAEFDYYDAQRLADWTNRHPGVVAWVRSQLGRPRQGWKAHGQWVDTRGGKNQPFLPDEKHRLTDPSDREHALSLVDGLRCIRRLLEVGGRSVRLTGLSGVGKTRFAQALFEETALPEALAPELAVYTDTAFAPDPSPLALLEELLAAGRRAILIVDNCGALLHNQLTARCKVPACVSLLTIEYDIREDLPPETNVFELGGASSELIEKVLGQQFPHITQVNVRTITEFADGNARVALALAHALDANDSLAGLKHQELLERLFWLGKEVQHELMVGAEACALVYSFNGEDVEGELAKLSSLASAPPLMLYRRVDELRRRGLVQSRGDWRAVLPHAIANTLAARALEAIPFEQIRQSLVAPQGRLLLSFSRRLGYLHESQKAVDIVRRWLSEGGLLGDVAGLSPLLVDVLVNVAPVDPAATLHAIKRAVNGPRSAEVITASSSSRSRIVRLVRLIAYEPNLFDECLEVLLAFARAEPEEIKRDSTRDVVASLFTIYLSGTHATLDQRAAWIRSALQSGDVQFVAIGFRALASALESHHFSSHYEFGFGARVRDFGAQPQGKEVRRWFETFIHLAASFAQGNGPLADRARDLLAQEFRPLWAWARMADSLEAAIGPLLEAGWERGWLAIRQTMQFDGKALPSALRDRLHKLEVRARPQTLIGHVKAVVLNRQFASLDFSEGEGGEGGEGVVAGYARAEQVARELGQQVATDGRAFAILLPLVVTNLQGRQWMFGAGLADKAPRLEGCWAALIQAFEGTADDQRNVQVLRGFLNGAFDRDRSKFERFLDEAIERPSLLPWVPTLQLSVRLDEQGCARLQGLLSNPAVSALSFQDLSLGRATQSLEDRSLADLLQRLSIKPAGMGIAIDVLFMHTYDNPNPIGPLVSDVARSLIVNAPLGKDDRSLDHQLAGLIRKFVAGSDGESVARRLLMNVRDGLEKFSVSGYDWRETLSALFRTQPQLALDILVGDECDDGRAYSRRRSLAGGRRSSALAEIPIEALLQWCRGGSANRWVHVAPLVPAFAHGDASPEPRWSERVLSLLQLAPEPLRVAESLVELIEPMSWVGSRAEAIRARLPLLDQLASVLGPEHAERVAAWRGQLMQRVDREARRELDEHRAQNERFE